MNIFRRLKAPLTILLLLVTSLVLSPHITHASSRYILTPTSASVSEGGSVAFTLSLQEPIISIDPDPYVRLTFSSTDPRISVSTTSMMISGDDWFHQFTFTVLTYDDAIINSTSTALIRMQTESNSEYYSNFVEPFYIYITDNDSGKIFSPSGGSFVQYGCKDIKASNYNYFSAHDQSLCVYQERKVATTTNINTNINTDSVSGENQVSFYKNVKLIKMDLKQGLNTPDVLTLQKFLIAESVGPAALALSKNGATSYFGPLTKKALIEWQIAHGLKASGIFDPLVREELLKMGK